MPRPPARIAPPQRRLGVAAILAAVLALAAPAPALGDPPAAARRAASEAPAAPVDFGAALAPLGEWVRLRDGARAWRPDGVAADWQPYRDGHWAWTSEGWFWVSAEPWSWATYHFGRWRLDPGHGWVWLPGGAWAPSRVVWRYGLGAVGWAPETDDRVILPAHWTFLPAARFAGAPAAVAALPAARVPELLVKSRLAGGTGPQPSARTAGAVELPAPARATVAAQGPVPARAAGAEASRAPAPTTSQPSPTPGSGPVPASASAAAPRPRPALAAN